MAKRNQPGIIRYTFGVGGKGAKALLNTRVLLLGLTLTAVAAALAAAVLLRPDATMTLRHAAAAQSRLLADGRQVTFFTAYLANHRQEALEARLLARTDSGKQLPIRGPAGENITLAAGERRRLSVALLSEAVVAGETLPIDFLLQDAGGKTLAETPAVVNAPTQDKDTSR